MMKEKKKNPIEFFQPFFQKKEKLPITNYPPTTLTQNMSPWDEPTTAQKNPPRRVRITSVEQTRHCVARHPRFCHRHESSRQPASKCDPRVTRDHPPASSYTPRGNHQTMAHARSSRPLASFIKQFENSTWFALFLLRSRVKIFSNIFYCYQQ